MTEEQIDALNQAVADIEGIWQDYCRSWEHGGPIIEREGMAIQPLGYGPNAEWQAESDGVSAHDDYAHTGPSALIAAMRAYVAAKGVDKSA